MTTSGSNVLSLIMNRAEGTVLHLLEREDPAPQEGTCSVAFPLSCVPQLSARRTQIRFWGGTLSAGLKAAGFDGVVMHDNAQALVYLWVDDEEADTAPCKLLNPLDDGANAGMAITREEVEGTKEICHSMDGQDDSGCPRPCPFASEQPDVSKQ